MKIFFIYLFLLQSVTAVSQPVYFLLIQTEKQQPFYIKMNETIYSSSGIGYLILPHLKDSTYSFTIGFPKNLYSEQDFTVSLNKKDHGLKLKNLIDKGWILFDEQSQEVIYPKKKTLPGGNEFAVSAKKSDEFSKMMSTVVNDTAVLYTIAYEKPKKIEKKPAELKDSETLIVKKKPIDLKDSETLIVKKKPIELKDSETLTVKKKPIELKDSELVTVKKKPAELKDSETLTLKKPDIKLLSQTSSDSGTLMLYVDKQKDTIKVFIPNSNAEKKHDLTQLTSQMKEVPLKDTSHIKDTAQVAKKEIIHRADTTTNPASPISIDTNETQKKEKKLVLINSDCKNFAAESDVDKLRVKMLQQKDIDDKITVARKLFKTRCFSTFQVRALTELFITEDGKYKFLDAAYPFVSDTGNFRDLISLFTDEYYIKRFKALVRLD